MTPPRPDVLYSVALRVESDPATGGPTPDEISAAWHLEPTATVAAGEDPLGDGDAWERHLWMLSVDGIDGESIEDLVAGLAAAMERAGCTEAAWRAVADRCEAYLWVGAFRAGEEARAALTWPVVAFAHRWRLPIHLAVLPEEEREEDAEQEGDGEEGGGASTGPEGRTPRGARRGEAGARPAKPSGGRRRGGRRG